MADAMRRLVEMLQQFKPFAEASKQMHQMELNTVKKIKCIDI
jgi:hypothetical protein